MGMVRSLTAPSPAAPACHRPSAGLPAAGVRWGPLPPPFGDQHGGRVRGRLPHRRRRDGRLKQATRSSESRRPARATKSERLPALAMYAELAASPADRATLHAHTTYAHMVRIIKTWPSDEGRADDQLAAGWARGRTRPPSGTSGAAAVARAARARATTAATAASTAAAARWRPR